MVHKQPYKNFLTDRLLLSWIRCRRKAWLDSFGNKDKKIWSAHDSLKIVHQQTSFSSLIKSKSGRGIEACSQGLDWVVNLKLKSIEVSLHGNPLKATVPLLKKIPGESNWGNFSYRPVLARQGRRVSKENRIYFALINRLLNKHQTIDIQKGISVSKTKFGLEVETVSINDKARRNLSDSLIGLSEDLSRPIIPPLISERKKCSICCWKSFCDNEAKSIGHLSEINGIGSKRKKILESLGISKIEDLATSDPIKLQNELEKFGSQHSDIADRIIQQAKSQFYGFAERLKLSPALPELNICSGVVIYDIESDPDYQEDFLHGFLIIERNKNGEFQIENSKYIPILSLTKSNQSYCWKRIKRKLELYKNWPILHYGETELITIRRIAKEEGVAETEIKELTDRFIDIHQRLRNNWRIPVNSYGLKRIASWIGFNWQQKGSDGSTAILWWRQWKSLIKKNSNPPLIIKLIFRYNKDDCLATWSVAEWLLKKETLLIKTKD